MSFLNTKDKNPTQLQILLDEIRFQQQKEASLQSQGEIGNFISRGTTYWTDVFVRHFLFQMDRSIDADDLLFFVRKRHVRGTVTLPKFQTNVEVFRKDSKKLPIGDPEIEWQETVFLNLIIHQLEYTLTLAICTRTSPKDLQVLKRHSQKVYASPSRRRMDTKGDFEEITYPFLCFMIDNFDEIYTDFSVRDGEMVCVELVANDRDHGFQAVLFLGSIRYDALKKVYDSRASLGSKMAQRMTFGLFSSSHHQRVEYVRLKGPHGKGHAEMAVSKPKGGVESSSPTSEPGFCITDGLWDSESESDTEDFMFKHHRRLSDPSSNLNSFSKSTWKTLKGSDKKKARSQTDDLDYCGLVEIEAGDVRDDSRSGSLWCCGCCGCECMNPSANSPIPQEPIPSDNFPCTSENERPCDHDCCCGIIPSPSCLPRSQSQSIPMQPLPLTPRSHISPPIPSVASTIAPVPGSSKMYSICSGTGTLPRSRRHPLIPSKTIIEEPRSCALLDLISTRERAKTIACLQDAKSLYRDKLLRSLPNKLTTTGVRVFYLCDNLISTETREAQNKIELDDGAYNPLWTMRGFTQTLYMWRETKRAQSVPLNAFLTYITLPYNEIIKDIMENREEPVLTF